MHPRVCIHVHSFTHLARPKRRRAAVLHRRVGRDEVQLRIRIAEVGAGVVARGAACDSRFASFRLGAQQGAEAGVLGRVEARVAALLEGFCCGEGEESREEGDQGCELHGGEAEAWEVR